MSNYILTIKSNREAILIGEIGALIHDIGKLHPDFIKSKSIEKTASDIHAQIDKFLDSTLLSLIKSKKFEINICSQSTNIHKLITRHHEKYEEKLDDIIKILKRCDGKDSADDKGIVRKKQPVDNTIICSPFGYPKEKIDLTCLQNRFNDLENNLTGLFKDYISGAIDLSSFRESLINNIKTSFSYTLGETRIPANDVTLWDHSYSTASMFKSALAAMICGAFLNLNNLKWRIFGICWNGVRFINNGRKIAEIKARSDIIENIKRKLKLKFENEIPIGNVIYEDTNGIYFTFPDLGEESKELAIECTKDALEIIYKESNNELWPFFTLSESSGTLTIIASELKFASEKRKIPKRTPVLFVEGKEEHFFENPEITTPVEGQDICPICRIRPKDVEKERCDVCEKRRKGRLNKWKQNREDTIWIDEVADKNNRIALISLNFYLDRWLDGTMIGTIYSQSFEDWYESRGKKIKENSQFMNKIKKSTNRELRSDSLSELAEYFMEFFIKEVLHDPEFKASQNDISLRAKVFNTFFEGITISHKEKNKQGKTNPLFVKNVWENFKEKLNKINSKNALHVLFTQNPSPARLYRIWQETEEFFDLVIGEILNNIYSNKWKRIKFSVEYNDLKSKLTHKNKLRYETTYIVQIDNLEPQKLLVFHNKNGEFYTIESLEKFKFNNKIGEEAIKEALKYGFNYLAMEDDPNKNLLKELNDTQKIKPDENSIEIEEYYPLIKINKSPLSLRLIVPALDSIKIIELITKLYNERFKKVLGKLPLNIKLLVAKRKFPLYILLEAENRMLEGDEFKKQVAMNPWWNVYDMKDDRYYSFYPTKPADEKDVYTLNELSSISKGKIFYLYPGYFDFDLLLGTTDRYNIYYNGKKRNVKDYKLFTGRSYYFYHIQEILELWDILSSNLSGSQINFIEEMLTSKLREWEEVKDINKQNVFREFAEATLKDAFSSKWENLRDETRWFLANSAINGLLLDSIILFRHVIKKGGEEDE